MDLIFTHGWGFGPEIWGPVLARIPMKHTIRCVDLGFFLDSNQTETPPPDAVCIGHSFGVLWLLKNATRPIRGLISISGFDRFVPHVSERTLTAMQRGLERNPMHQLELFWKACGLDGYSLAAPPATLQLKEGLGWLKTLSAEEELKNLTCPVLAIASRDDQIVSHAMSCAIWGEENLCVSETGGHILPLTQTDWVAQQIERFINKLEHA